MNPTAESLIKDYADPIEQQEIESLSVRKWADRFTDTLKECRELTSYAQV